jgi:hypothetical protein
LFLSVKISVISSKNMKKHSHCHDPGTVPGKVTAAARDCGISSEKRSSKTAPDWQDHRLLMKSMAVSRSSSVMTGSDGGAAV